MAGFGCGRLRDRRYPVCRWRDEPLPGIRDRRLISAANDRRNSCVDIIAEVVLGCRTERRQSSANFMARKLKTYQTSLGFFDLALAAPSMKAALQAWGADSNLFHQGVAKESKDPDVIAATMSKPGVILRRPVGSDGPFKEDADLPTHLPSDRSHRPREGHTKPKQHSSRAIDQKADPRAAQAFEREQRRGESDRRKEDAARDKERERRQRAIAKAQAALEEAERQHEKRAAIIDAERDALEEKSQAEDARWEKERSKLETALRRAQD
jgi:hypothetical protein